MSNKAQTDILLKWVFHFVLNEIKIVRKYEANFKLSIISTFKVLLENLFIYYSFIGSTQNICVYARSFRSILLTIANAWKTDFEFSV